MAESQAFFDRPREPRVGFEIPVPRYPRWSRGSPKSAIRAEETGRIGVRFDSLQEGSSVHPHQIRQIFQRDAKTASGPTHFGTHPEGPVSDARWRTTADED